MLRLRDRPQLCHQPEHCDEAIAELRSGAEGRFHRCRVGVVAVVDNDEAAAMDLHPPWGSDRRLDAGNGGLKVSPGSNRGGGGRRRIESLVGTRHRQPDLDGGTKAIQDEPCPSHLVELDIRNGNIRPGVFAEAKLFSLEAQPTLPVWQDRDAIFAEGAEQLSLGRGELVRRSEGFEVHYNEP